MDWARSIGAWILTRARVPHALADCLSYLTSIAIGTQAISLCEALILQGNGGRNMGVYLSNADDRHIQALGHVEQVALARNCSFGSQNLD